MSVFDLFRGFFGVPGGQYRGHRDPFFDTMTHDDDDEDDEDEGMYFDGFRGDHQDPFDSAWRFGFSFGPDGMRIQEPPVFGQVFREMEEIFSQLGHWDGHSQLGHRDVPGVMPAPPQEGAEKGVDRSRGNPLRDFMLKSPDSDARRRTGGPPGDASPSESPDFSRSPYHGWTPFSKFHDIWRQESQNPPEDAIREDVDLDSIVQSGGLDQILSPPAGRAPSEPRARSFFQSVVVTKVVKPDGTVEERRTVRDGQGNEETTVTRSGGPGALQGPDPHTPPPVLPGAPRHFSDLRDDQSLFSKFFGGFK
ncbi:HCLS1-associated protein X-1 [Salarias fasciatus]|uniref:HCLS1 associated protein X-1 n=1 Tax=Salarias fasciatus TaxID=181472 RepID=A0A672F9G0_SALFA|nr:HCLS1-associated protein X-1 [Salarias fasciatus]